MKTYNEEWKERHANMCHEHEKKMNAVMKPFGGPPHGLFIKFWLGLSIVAKLSGYVALAMVPFSDVELLHAACLFVIGYIIGETASSYDKAVMGEFGLAPTEYMGRILTHNALIGEDIREIKKLLKSQQRRKDKADF